MGFKRKRVEKFVRNTVRLFSPFVDLIYEKQGIKREMVLVLNGILYQYLGNETYYLDRSPRKMKSLENSIQKELEQFYRMGEKEKDEFCSIPWVDEEERDKDVISGILVQMVFAMINAIKPAFFFYPGNGTSGETDSR